MQTIPIIAGGTHLFLALILGPLVLYIAFRVFAATTRDLDELQALKNDNHAAGILLASIFLATGLVVVEVMTPVVTHVETVLYTGTEASPTWKLLAFGLGYLVSAVTLAILGISITTRFFLRLTRGLDELSEIAKGNVAVAITLGAAIVVNGMFLSKGVASLLIALIPYPELSALPPAAF